MIILFPKKDILRLNFDDRKVKLSSGRGCFQDCTSVVLKSGRFVLLNDEVLDWFPEISEKKFEKVENFRSKSNYQISHMVKRLAQKPILTPILKG